MANSIWKDYYVNLGTAESIIYRIKVGDTTIYTGNSHLRPGQTENIIRINDICADYLSQATADTYPVTFTIDLLLKTAQDEPADWEYFTEVQFINDWSYDESYNPETQGMSFPIINRIHKSQWFIYTSYNATSLTLTLTLLDGSSTEFPLPVKVSSFLPQNTDFTRDVMSAGKGTAVTEQWIWGDVDYITINGKTWKMVDGCYKYALYYLNAYGGWDTLLIEGNTQVTDNLTRHTRDAVYDNTEIQNRGTRNYLNEISKTFTLHTSWLSDDESSRMHHLLNSPNVYLLDMETKEMMPVVLTNTTTEYKTYKGNGGKLVNYTIEATLAQERIRR